MARRTIVHLIDDLDGTEIPDGSGTTLEFGIDGSSYSIDLTASNADKLRRALDKYVSTARKTPTARRRGAPRAIRSETAPDARAVRAWAASNDVKVSNRGRIPADVVLKFQAAGNSREGGDS